MHQIDLSDLCTTPIINLDPPLGLALWQLELVALQELLLALAQGYDYGVVHKVEYDGQKGLSQSDIDPEDTETKWKLLRWIIFLCSTKMIHCIKFCLS